MSEVEILIPDAGNIFWAGLVLGATWRAVKAALSWFRGRGGSIVD